MAADEEAIRLNSSSQCSICNQRVRVYRTSESPKQNPLAWCPTCDCDSSRPIGYAKKRRSV